MAVSVVVKNSCTTTGEGPHWEEDSNCLLYVDITAQDIHKFNTLTGQDEKVHLDATASLIVPRRSGGYIVGLGHSLSVVDWGKGTAVSSLATVEVGMNTRFNDGKCDISGRLWAGSMGNETVPGKPDRKLGALYSLSRNGSIQSHLSEIDISNGLAWTSDNKTMFFIDSYPRKVYAFDFDLEGGAVANQRVAVDFETHSIEDWGYPDGMTIDVNGNIWVASYGGGKVMKFDSQTMQLLQTISFPAKRITSCAFGGPHYDDLYVTSGVFGADDTEKAAFPLAGSVFKVTGLGVKGLPAPIYEA